MFTRKEKELDPFVNYFICKVIIPTVIDVQKKLAVKYNDGESSFDFAGCCIEASNMIKNSIDTWVLLYMRDRKDEIQTYIV